MTFTRPYVGSMVALVVCVVIAAIMEPLLPALMRPLVDETLDRDGSSALWEIPLLLIVVVFFRGLADYGVTYASQYLATRTVQDIRQALFSKAMIRPIDDHEGESPGRTLSRITYDTYMVSEAITEVWMVAIKDSFVLVALIIFLFYTSWQLTIFIFISAPIMIFAIRRIGIRLRRSSSEVQIRLARLTDFVQESLSGIKEVKIFNAVLYQERNFFQRSLALRQEQIRSVRNSALAGPLVSLLTAFTVSGVIYLASGMSASGNLSTGEFISFITALAMIFGPIRKLTSINLVLQRGLAAAESIFFMLDKPDEAGDKSEILTLVYSHQKNKTEPLESTCAGHLIFDRIGFHYPKHTKLVLDNLNLEIQCGEAVAITGSSGSGKSTIIELIARFREPTTGAIFLDGKNINTWDLHRFRANVALVSQNVLLFDGTIEDNLRLGNMAASSDDLERAIDLANATDFIRELPDGIHTALGARGSGLSGGQRQRIAIARAFLKDAPIMLLDEITSALDRENEDAVLHAVEKLLLGRTVILVSHAPERLKGITRVIRLS